MTIRKLIFVLIFSTKRAEKTIVEILKIITWTQRKFRHMQVKALLQSI